MTDEVASLVLKVDSGQVKLSTKDLALLQGQSKKTEKATGFLTKKNLALAASFIAVATATKALTASITAARDFEAAASDLSAITGATGESLKFLTDSAKEFGQTTTLSASQAVEAFKLVASAKPDLLENAAALKAVTREAITLAEASGIQLPDAAKTLGNSLNQFNKDASESTRFINVLAAGAKFGSSEITDTADALEKAGVVAAGANLSFEETNAAIQALAANGIKGAEAGTQLKTVLLRLQTQNDQSINPSIVGLSAALENLAAKNLTTAEMQKLFGQEAIVAGNILASNSDKVADLTEKLTGTNTALEQAIVKNDNLAGSQKRFASAMEAAAIATGEKMTPALRDLTDQATDVITVFLDANKATDGLVSSADGLADVAGFAVNALAFSVKTLDVAFTGLGLTIGAVGASAVAFFKGDFKESSNIMDLLGEDLDKLGQGMLDFEASLRKAAEEREKIKQERQKQKEDSAASSDVRATDEIVATPITKERKTTRTTTDEEKETQEKRNKTALEGVMKFLQDKQQIELEAEDSAFQRRKEILENNLGDKEAEYGLLQELERKHQNTIADIIAQGQERALDITRLSKETQNAVAASAFRDALRIGATGSKKLFELNKKVALSEAIISGFQAINNGFSTKPFFPVGLAMGTLAAVKTSTQIKAIKNQQFGGGAVGVSSGGGVGGVSLGANSSAPPSPTVPPRGDIAAQQGTQRQVVVVNAEGSVFTATDLLREVIIPEINAGIRSGQVTEVVLA